MLTRRLCDVLFDIADGLFRLLVPAVRHQPPRALRHETTEQQDAEAQDGSDARTSAARAVVETVCVWSGRKNTPSPTAAGPGQKLPLATRSIRPRYFAGM